MILRVFAVFDVKAKYFMQPFVMKTSAEAVRVFGDMCQNAQNPLGRHPADYTLFEIGQYDDASAMFTQDGAHVPLGNGLEHVVEEEPLRLEERVAS